MIYKNSYDTNSVMQPSLRKLYRLEAANNIYLIIGNELRPMK